jgi:hypothetical protein
MFSDAGFLSVILVVIWLTYPVAFQTVLHPSDAVNFQNYIRGLPIVHYMTAATLAGGLFIAISALAVLSLIHIGVLVLIYRRVQYHFTSWVVALVLVGGIANILWYIRTGYFDLWGAVAGFAPVFLMLVLETVFEHVASNLVFGASNA